MKLLVLGSGLNSFVTASLFASIGNQIYLNSKSQSIDRYQYEPGLLPLFNEQVAENRVKSLVSSHLQSADYQELKFDIAILGEEAEEYSQADLDWLIKRMSENCFLVLLTPSDIGEADELKQKVSEQFKSIHAKSGAIDVISCPLLIREGRALADFSRPEKIIAGCDSPDAVNLIKRLFGPFNRLKNVIKFVSSREAEFTCFASHAMLATRLSFMNEMAELAERTLVDIETVRECMGADPRIGSSYLYPGCGYGGYTLSKNVEKVSKKLMHRNDDVGLLEAVSEINKRQKDILFRKVWRLYRGNLDDKKIAIWGGSFKPDTDSIIGSPALNLIKSLVAHGAEVSVYDPMANNNIMSYCEERGLAVSVVDNALDATISADALVVCTEWKEFWCPDFNELAQNLKSKVIFDGRNIYNISQLKEYGLQCFGIGRMPL